MVFLRSNLLLGISPTLVLSYLLCVYEIVDWTNSILTKSRIRLQSDVWGTISDQGIVTHITGGNFAQSSITINGWLRDFLWAQASLVIQSYGSSLSAYGLFFLGAHFVWAFSLMFYSAAVVIGKNSLNLSFGLITN